MKVLVIAPHPDDETLGVGGTLKRLTSGGHDVAVLTVAAHMPPLYSEEVHERTVEEAKAAQSVLGVKDGVFLSNPAVMLGDLGPAKLNSAIQEHVDRIRPDVLFVPYYDRHIDHRQIFDACMVAARPVGSGKDI
jgi:LmbE family N-acetylglucosaminyl deacetylase